MMLCILLITNNVKVPLYEAHVQCITKRIMIFPSILKKYIHCDFINHPIISFNLLTLKLISRDKYIYNIQENKLFWKKNSTIRYCCIYNCPKQIFLRFRSAPISLPPSSLNQWRTRNHMGIKKSAFIPAKFGKENATGVLSHSHPGIKLTRSVTSRETRERMRRALRSALPFRYRIG